MAQEDVRLSGTFLDSTGQALVGKTATLFSEGTTTPALATDTTDSAGEWDFTRATPGRYDVQLVTGAETLRILGRDKFQVTELQSRNATSLTQPAGIFTNTYTNGGAAAAGLAAIYSFRPATESTGVESAVAGVNGSSVYNDFQLTNSATTPEDFIAGRLAFEAVDVANGSEDSKLNLWTMKAGTLTEVLHLDGTSLHPETTDVVSLGTSALNFSDLFLDSGAVVNFDSGNLTLTHSAGLLTVSGGLTVSGATTLNGNVTLGSAADDVITVNGTVAGANAVIFEGATGGVDANETTLNITDPTADATIKLPAMSAGTYFLPVLDTASSVAITAIPGEINYLDLGATAVGNAIASKAVVLDSDKDYTGIRNLTATTFVGALTGNVTGNTSGTAATVTTPAQGNITSLGTLSTLTVDNVIVNGTTIGHTSDTDLLTLTSANLAVAGDLEVSGSVEVGTIDYTDGDNAITIADGGGITAAAGITSTAAANTLGATSFNDASITNVNDIALDSISADGTDINVAVSDNSATALTVKQGSDAYLIIDTANSSESVSIGTGISGTAITLGHGTSEVTVADNLTVTGDLTVSGTQTVVDTVTMNAANAVVFEGATANAHETTLTIEDPTADRTVVIPNVSGTLAVLAADSDVAITSTPAELNLLDGVSGLVQADFTKLAALDATAAELDLTDGNSTIGTTAVSDGHGIVMNHSGTMAQTTVQTLAAYLDDEITAMPNLVSMGTVTTGTWQAADVGVEHGGTGVSELTDHGVVLGSGTGAVSVTAAGTSGQVLTSGGSGADPDWATPTVGDITGVTAGVGLSGGGTAGALTITLDLSELSTVTPADGDFFSTLDSDGANEQKTTTTALATLFAGAGMTATSSVLNVIGGTGITANADDIAIDSTVMTLAGVQTITGTKTLNGTSSTPAIALLNAVETTTITASVPPSTVNFDVATQSVLIYTTAANATWITNLRFSSGTSLNTALATGQSVSITLMAVQGGTAYLGVVFKIDGTTVTPLWQEGIPTSAGASGTDVYTFTVTKTANATYRVIASMTSFK